MSRGSRARWAPRAAALLGLIWFLQIGGGPTLDPTNLEWLLAGDWKQHLLGWLMFRHEPWTLPLGTLSQSLYPVGSALGFTDSNPLVSILLKPFSGALPIEFQFIGPWLALCFMLQGYTGAKLAGVLTDEPAQQMLAGYLFVLSPALMGRLNHDTLCAQWLVLALLYFGVRDSADDRTRRRSVAASIGLLTIASGIHPYLAAMCWTLAMALYVKLWRQGHASLARAASYLAAATAAMIATLALLGYLGRAQVAGVGFGEYSSDLLTLINPMDHSRLMPRLPMKPWQGEGLGFLGVGGIFAVVIAMVMMARQRRAPGQRAWPVIAACALMGVYALSSSITIAGRDLIDLGWLYRPIAPIVAPFRASGRFIWPLHYLLLTFGVWGLLRAFGPARQAAGTALLGLAVALQAGDMRVDTWWASPKTFRQASTVDFRLAAGRYRHLALAPMQVFGVCSDAWDEDHVYRFMLVAYRLKLTYNSGIFARMPAADVRAACQAIDRTIDAGRLDPDTIYIVHPDRVPGLRTSGAACGRSDGDWICVARDSDPVFRTYVETGQIIGR
jgi:hypothetical protein